MAGPLLRHDGIASMPRQTSRMAGRIGRNSRNALIDCYIVFDSKRTYVAIGEIGFDLHWDKTTLDIQQQAFRQQVDWAKSLNLPIVIHVREAFDALFEALDALNDVRLTGVVHCFTGNLNQAERILDYGNFFLGIGGVATYKNGGLDKVLPHVPHDRIILETDSPYLAPVPHRGKRNESAYTRVVAQRVADLWEMPLENVADITTQNARTLFNLSPQ